MLRISLIGAGDIKYHFHELLEISEEEFNKHIDEISKALLDFELVLLPDRGVCFEVAKKHKELSNEKIFGTVPLSDKDFGIDHLKPFIEHKIDGKPVFDEIIDTNNWYKQDLTCCTFGDAVLMLGNSLGALGELAYGYYLLKLFSGKKPELNILKKKVHPQIKTGENVPFSTIIYKPFFKDKIPFEIEQYIKKTGGNIYYVENSKELVDVLKKQIY